MLLAEFDKVAYKSLLFTGLSHIEVFKRENGPDIEALRIIESTRVPDNSTDHSFKSETVVFESPNLQLPKWLVVTMDVNILDNFKEELENKYQMKHLLPMRIAAALDSEQVEKLEHNLFCTLPLPVTTPLPAHISAPLILEQERRNVRLDSDGTGIESKYNHWLLSSEIPRLYLCLLEKLLQIQGVNDSWWPGSQSGDANVPFRITMDAFWSSEILGKSSRRVFASKFDPTSFLSPSDVIVFSKDALKYSAYNVALSKVLSVIRPSKIVELSIDQFEYSMKAQLRSLDGAFLKMLLERADPPSQWLAVEEIDALLRYLLKKKVSLDGLSLIPLEDGSCTKIHSQYTATNYVVEPEQTAAYNLFRPNRLVHRKCTSSKSLLELGVNVSRLNDAGIVELIEERISPAQELNGDETHQTWITSFWNAKLNVSLDRISHIPLIPTLEEFHFISMSMVKDDSVTLVASESTEGFDYGILQKIGMTIVVQSHLSEALGKMEGKQTPYNSFLEYVYKNEAEGLQEISCLSSSDREGLANWVQSEFANTPENLADVAYKVPVWRVDKAKSTFLAALNDVTVLPVSIPSNTLQYFTDHVIINWKTCMQKVKKGCNAQHITEILNISPETILHSRAEKEAYKKFIVAFLKLSKVESYSLLVPNGKGVLTPAETLFERHDLFSAAFKAAPERLLHNDFQDIAESLGTYSLNLGSRLDLDMFIECAKAFHQDNDNDESDEDGDDGDKRERSGLLYRKFNNLSLQYGRDTWRCGELDQLRFIPRDTSGRNGYDGINIGRYMRDDILSPGKITLAEYEPICWSQRGRVNPQPNPALCGTYKNLGKPTGKEIVRTIFSLLLSILSIVNR